MDKKIIAHRDIRKIRLWRNFFLLYSASLAALYIALSVSANAEQPSFYKATSQINSYPDTVTSGTISSQTPGVQLASYEAHKK